MKRIDETSWRLQTANMAAEHGSSDRASSKRHQSGNSGSPSPMRGQSPARDRGPAAMEYSPKRFTIDESCVEAASPSAPTHDMSTMELTHVYQNLAAQAALDKQWAGRVEFAITDRAQWLDRHKCEGSEVKLRRVLIAWRRLSQTW